MEKLTKVSDINWVSFFSVSKSKQSKIIANCQRIATSNTCLGICCTECPFYSQFSIYTSACNGRYCDIHNKMGVYAQEWLEQYHFHGDCKIIQETTKNAIENKEMFFPYLPITSVLLTETSFGACVVLPRKRVVQVNM